MPAKAKAKAKGAASKKSRAKSRPQPRPQKESPAAESSRDAERDAQNFTRGILIRGEAARPDEGGNLPSGATHEIVGEDEEGLPVIERKRYSAF